MFVSTTEKIDFLKKVFGNILPDRNYINISVECPECLKVSGKHKMKLAIHTTSNAFHCWRCGIKGRSLIFILKKYFPSFLKEYIDKFEQGSFCKLEDENIKETLTLPSDFLFLAENIDSSNLNVKLALKYLISRGIKKRDLWYFKFGVSSQYEFKNRVIVPSFDNSGILNYYSARRFDKNKYHKYHNPEIDRKNIIFNEINIDWSKPLLLVEGPFDLVKCPNNTVPILGSELNEESLLFAKILENNTPVMLALDSDMKKKTNRFAKRLFSYDINVSIVNWGAKDPGELTKKQVLYCITQKKTWSQELALFDKISSI